MSSQKKVFVPLSVVVCGLVADSDSVHQADNRLPAMRLQSP